MTLTRFITAAFLVVALAMPAHAGEGTYSDADQRALEALLPLNFKKHSAVMKELGIEPAGNFYDCLCRQARYGSSNTRQFFHPGRIGEYNPRYSCNQAGPPCVVSGYGCSRHPLPKDSDIYAYCEAQARKAGGAEPLSTALDGVQKRRKPPKPDVEAQYRQCHDRFEMQRALDGHTNTAAALTYLGNSGVPLVAPPGHIAKKIRRDIDDVAANMERTRKKQKAAASEHMLATVAKSVLQNKETYTKALGGTLTHVEARKTETKKELAALDRNMPRARPNETLDTARLKRRDAAVARKRVLEAKYLRLQREEKALNQVLGAIGHASTMIDVKNNILAMAGDDPRRAAEGAVSTLDIAKKYLDDAGLDKAAVGVLDGVVDSGKKALAAHKIYTDMLGVMDSARAMARSGKYTEAQTRLIAGFEALGKIGEATAAYMPPGAQEIMLVYSEAMKTPGAMHKFLTQATERADVMADISGSQAKSKAMRATSKVFGDLQVNHDGYLSREAKLAVYADDYPKAKIPGTNEVITHAAIPDQNADPIFLTARQYRRLQEFAYYWPIAHGKRMDDADIAAHFGKVGGGGLPSIDDLRKKADGKIKEAARRQKVAEMFGKKTVTLEEKRLYDDFEQEVDRSLPFGCALDSRTRKALFGAWREDPRDQGAVDSLWRGLTGTPAKNEGRESVKAFLQEYGARMARGKARIEGAK